MIHQTRSPGRTPTPKIADTINPIGSPGISIFFVLHVIFLFFRMDHRDH